MRGRGAVLWAAAGSLAGACAQLLDLEDGALEGPPLVSVPGGPFTMGCGIDPLSCDLDETPLHTVRVSAFEIDESEVTLADYRRCVDDDVCLPATCGDPDLTPDLPVTCVTWFQARVYCGRLGKRLPTEAEWEKAARGSNDDRLWPWGATDPTCELANFSGCGGASVAVGTHPLGRSPYGPLDLAGNVSEWVADRYDAAYYGVTPEEDPTGPATGTGRVYRGGSYSAGAGGIRTFNRDGADPTVTSTDRGFRCAR